MVVQRYIQLMKFLPFLAPHHNLASEFLRLHAHSLTPFMSLTDLRALKPRQLEDVTDRGLVAIGAQASDDSDGLITEVGVMSERLAAMDI